MKPIDMRGYRPPFGWENIEEALKLFLEEENEEGKSE